MEYVQRAIYGPKHKLSGMAHDRIHLADGDATLCGKILNQMWMITGDTLRHKKEITCHKCKAAYQQSKGEER